MIDKLYQIYLEHREVCTDTRKISQNCIFFALKGPNFNANTFASAALAGGAAYVVIDDPEFAVDERCLLVGDVLTTLQELARHHRQQLDIPVIGLTGSNGKTTTKELIASVLATKFKVRATAGNLNNHIGVPLTLLSIDSDDEIAIVEMGANHQGEIHDLCSIALPSHGMITNIGKAHLEGFGGIAGVIKGKTELYRFLAAQGGTVFVNANNTLLSEQAAIFSHPVLYPRKGDFYHCEFTDASPHVSLISESGTHIVTHLIGAYNFENIAAALCIGKYFDVPPQQAEAAIAGYIPANNRSQVMHRGGNMIILDAYNANPTSMRSALENLQSMEAGRKVVILGDMKELGHESAMEHRSIGKFLAECSFDAIYLVGEEMKHAAGELECRYFADKRELADHLKQTPLKETLVLLKGSRSMGLESLLELI